jgi:Abnormal spindle-like microcephaly-assoc'd, ASPM-SPD-2-Hydin
MNGQKSITTRSAYCFLALTAVAVLTGIASLVGCQGVSSGTSTNGASSTTQTSSLSLANTNLSFGTVSVGNQQSSSETITNVGTSSVRISQIGVRGSGFSTSGISAPVSLSAGQSVAFNVLFAPKSAGSASGNVIITSDAANPSLSIVLSGTGSATPGQLTVTPATLGVGNVVVGTSGAASGKLTAAGANVTVTSASANNSMFSVGGLSLPVTIPAGQSASFTVTFSPPTTGAVSASLTFASNAQSPTTAESLTGTGTPAPTHAVNLSWNASTSSNISGYNVYRATYVNSCTSFSKINSVVNTSTLYTDTVVVDGTAYCYATTAVNFSNQESGYSNILSNIQIPAP